MTARTHVLEREPAIGVGRRYFAVVGPHVDALHAVLIRVLLAVCVGVNEDLADDGASLERPGMTNAHPRRRGRRLDCPGLR